MQRLSKDLDKKFEIISKIQSGLRRKKIQHLTFLETTNIEFPPIKSVCLTFPISKPDKAKAVHSIHTPPPNPSLKAELERLFEKNHLQTNANAFNRIIFTNPLKTKLAFESSFRTSFLKTIDHPSNKTRYRSFSKDKLLTKHKQKQGESLKNKERVTGVVEDVKATTPKLQSRSPQFSNILDLNPEQLRQTQAKLANTIRQSRLLVPRKEKSTLARYSPWGGHQNDQQLII